MNLHTDSRRRLGPLPILIALATFFCPSSLRFAIGDAAPGSTATFIGKFSNDKLTLELSESGGALSGTITLGTNKYPTRASVAGQELKGTFAASGAEFPFTATFAEGRVILVSGGRSYSLVKAVENPLADNGAPAAPVGAHNSSPQSSAPTQNATDAPAGYSIAAATDIGKAWVTKKSGMNTVAAALGATLPDMATFFGDKPVIKGAFEDTKDHQSGAASFTAILAGQPIMGLITCKLGDNEAKISVTYCLANATAADWGKLNAVVKATKPPAPDIKLTRFDFPDGTGSVGIAEGWALKSGSVLDPLYVTGPGDQTMGSPGLWWISIETPDSPHLRQIEEMRNNARRMGRQPLLFASPVVAPFSDPEHALPVIFPQWNALRTAQHLDSVAIDPITFSKTMPPQQPAWKTQVLEYGLTKTTDGVPKHYRVRATWTSMPGLDAYHWSLSPLGNMVAPDATFDQDLVTMQVMSKSIQINWDAYFKVDWERFAARMKANQQQFDERMKEQRRQYVEQMKSYDEHNRQWAIDENRKSRNAADWIEYAGGYRTVIDTQTGERTKVDLSNVNGIVNGLNDVANDPHRYVQIPLRDERDPLIAPGQ